MAQLRELLTLVGRQLKLEPARVTELEHAVRRTWPGERVYIAPCDSKRDPARKAAIRQAAKQLPTRVVAERHGVSEQYVRRVIKKNL